MNLKFLDKQHSKFFELVFITAFWLLLFMAPLFFQWINKGMVNWVVLLNVWSDYIPLLIVFAINRGILIPQVLFKNTLPVYLLTVAVLISVTVFGSISVRDHLYPEKTPTAIQGGTLRFPDANKAKTNRKLQTQKVPLSAIPPYVNLVLLSILLVGFDTGMKLSVNYAQALQKNAEVEKENIKNELAFLRNQISPHFLMNTLNNIHALIDFDSKEAQRSIAKLSVLMRHLLYESDAKPTTLQKEITFIKSYIELMQLRYSDDVQIKLELPEQILNISIPPLLFTNILENAFKYGISYEEESFVYIKLELRDAELEFQIKNSVPQQNNHAEQHGIGINNTEKRLKLLYQTNYTFTHGQKDNIFTATIKIPI
ncbi:sensor histidine kinase [Winogradskyella vidalii]|uniref:sensor histidine kinase n=1 Tax=Winogradskyella vidalii TaxID=2615024 RepID=UPI0015CC00E6|nr:histidine kinase [Winogradskyella vidalii]